MPMQGCVCARIILQSVDRYGPPNVTTWGTFVYHARIRYTWHICHVLFTPTFRPCKSAFML